MQDGEPFEIITDQSQRWFYVNEPLQVSLKEEGVQITSYFMKPISKVSVWALIPELETEVMILELETVDALSQKLYRDVFNDPKKQFKTRDDDMISISTPVSEADIKFSVESEDSLFKKITSLEPHWKVTFGNYSGGNWREINALYAREWIIMITNMAAVFDSDEMLYSFTAVNYPKSNNNGKHFHTDSGYYYSSQVDYEALLTQIYNKEHFNVGVTAIGGGLGGGATLGVDTWVFYSHYYGSNSEDSALIAHEMGHGLGFGHSSSFCYGEFQAYVQDLYGLLLRTEDLPYTDDSVNGLYKEENTQYRYNGVAQDYRQKRKGLNSIEKFIIANPGPFTQDAEILKQYQ